MILGIPRQGREVLRWRPPKVRRWRTGSSLAGGWRSTNRRLLDWSWAAGPFVILLDGTLRVDNDRLFLFFFFFFLDFDDFDGNFFKILGPPYFLGFEIGFFLYKVCFSRILRFFINVDYIVSEIIQDRNYLRPSTFKLDLDAKVSQI